MMFTRGCMDEIDRKLLFLLQEEENTSYDKLSGSLGLSVSEVKERIKKLHQNGVTTAGWKKKTSLDNVGLGLDFIFDLTNFLK